ncbi:hypothetical protein [Bifidobacterium biavatii]|uniref:Uncharacterized protein n=1 Tax=Bifidobacterium biavatii DSM 23969 TaxID=1437608 RepID=A0A086ZYX0_9BIFI|nr:hypothetical protein [Bifidobacterium biavatii]KFI51720.1 hypothetical protein BBIA_0634 [Bifidobacterium biavatii DSM 23969]
MIAQTGIATIIASTIQRHDQATDLSDDLYILKASDLEHVADEAARKIVDQSLRLERHNKEPIE